MKHLDWKRRAHSHTAALLFSNDPLDGAHSRLTPFFREPTLCGLALSMHISGRELFGPNCANQVASRRRRAEMLSKGHINKQLIIAYPHLMNQLADLVTWAKLFLLLLPFMQTFLMKSRAWMVGLGACLGTMNVNARFLFKNDEAI